jgi:hypothetical protein
MIHKLNQLFIILLIGVLPLWGCGDALKSVESDITIKVSGTDGLMFSGYYSIVATGSSPKPINVKGSVPSEYQGKGVMGLCVFQKASVDGSLKIQILKDGKVVAEGDSAVPEGVVTLKTPLPSAENIIIQILKKFMG